LDPGSGMEKCSDPDLGSGIKHPGLVILPVPLTLIEHVLKNELQIPSLDPTPDKHCAVP
jgi:hypothetical protein